MTVPDLDRRQLGELETAALLAIYLRKYWVYLETGRGFPRLPFSPRRGHTVISRKWFDCLSVDAEYQLGYLARDPKHPTPHPKESLGRGVLRADVLAVLVIIARMERAAAARRRGPAARKSGAAAPKAKPKAHHPPAAKPARARRRL
jgi:hypothetical protein